MVHLCPLTQYDFVRVDPSAPGAGSVVNDSARVLHHDPSCVDAATIYSRVLGDRRGSVQKDSPVAVDSAARSWAPCVVVANYCASP